MADAKISALTAATTPLAGTEVLPLVQSGTTKKVSVANLTAGRAVSSQSQTVTDFVKIDSTVADQVGTYGVMYGTSGVGLSIAGYSIRFLVNSYAPSNTGNVSFTLYNGGDVGANIGNFVPLTAGKGINFTANTPAAGMTSQLLNWYEEGTWTPTDSSGAGLTLTVANAVYTRVGRLVTVSAVITYPTTASALAIEMSGLPFTAGQPASGTALTNSNQTNIALVNSANTYVRLYTVPNAAFTRPTNADFSGKSIYLNITYPV